MTEQHLILLMLFNTTAHNYGVVDHCLGVAENCGKFKIPYTLTRCILQNMKIYKHSTKLCTYISFQLKLYCKNIFNKK